MKSSDNKRLILMAAKVLLVLGGGSLVGCSGSDSSKAVDANGNCTSETVTTYNDIRHKAQMFVTTSDTEYLKGAANSCGQLNGLLSGKSCTAQNTKTNEPMTISYSTVADVCSKVNAALNPGTTDQGKSEPAKSDSTKLADVPGGIQIKINDDTKIRELLAAGSTVWIQNGRLYYDRETSNLDLNAPMCVFDKRDASFDLRKGDVLQLTAIRIESRKLTMLTADKKLAIGCVKRSYYSSWTLGDLREAFSSSADVR